MRDAFSAEHGREPTVSELSELSGHSPEDVTEALAAGQPPMSLTVETEDGTGELEIPTPAPENGLIRRIALEKAISSLEEKDRRLITMRYFQGKTQTEIAAALGMTQVQASRREKSCCSPCGRNTFDRSSGYCRAVQSICAIILPVSDIYIHCVHQNIPL